MKKDFARLFSGLMLTAIAVTGCSSSSDDDPMGGLLPDKEETVTGQYGLVASDVRNYFASVINGSEATYETAGPLEATDIEGAQKYVWGIWKNAVNRNTGERLPVLNSHYSLQYWDDITAPDATWNLPDGNMDFFYGSKGDRPASGYPLFIFLHGSGDDSNAEWTATLAWNQVFADGPSAYFVPKSPLGGTDCRWYQPSRQAKWENLICQALAADNIDPDKIYFAGISEGAYGTQRLASFYADYLAGAGPIAGGEILVNCPPENLANIAFCLQTGSRDTSYGRSRLTQKVGTLLDDLAAAHPGLYNHKVDLQPGKTHSNTDYTVATPWLVNYSRTINPKYVYWENYGLGKINGEDELRYRDAFYNLYILEPSDARDNDLYRTAYEMTINGNTVDLTVNNVTLTPNEPVTVAGWTGNIGVEKTYAPATTGKVRIYLNNQLVDLSRPVTVRVNGVEKFNGTISADTRNMVESCAIFYDPARVFPAAVEVSVQ